MKKIIMVIITILFTLSVVYTLLNNFLIVHQTEILTIISTGQNNPLAKGSEVWLSVNINGKQVNYDNYDLDGWEVRDSAIVSYLNQPSLLVIPYNSNQHVKISFMRHQYCGIVEINNKNKTIEKDLFEDTNSLVSPYVYETSNTFIELSYLFIWVYLVILFIAIIFNCFAK